MRRDIIATAEYQAPCGRLVLGSYADKLCMCDWLIERHHARVSNRLREYIDADFIEGTSDVIARAGVQLDEYFSGRRKAFDIPLMFVGTEFQKSVWNALLDIPYGTTAPYGAVARMIGRPKAVRAVANANGTNALSIFAPCHRVVGSDNSLTGYGGGIEAKKFLLELEGCI
ncbi:MAG: methylated-DNA--[protein]-cysteine S-methyltransferase [Muribaculaceae bacterium]|nr:methylated-DNA--[protein]-cysteine S-methyltransferase [Muribaculaceae bacterium]